KVLLELPPRLRSLCSEVPAALDELVAAMLAKEPGLRPGDGAAVLAALPASNVARDTPTPRPASTNASAALTGLERRTVSVVLSGHVPSPSGPDDDTSSAEAPTARATGAPQ